MADTTDPSSEIPLAAATVDVASESSPPGLVPPPLASEIDTLLEAVSVAGRSPVQKSAGERRVLGAASPVRGSSTLLAWQPAIFRGVAPSIAAFLVGALGALWGLRALPPTSPAPLENVVTTADVPMTSGSSPLAPAPDPLPPNLPPLPAAPLIREATLAAAQQVADMQRAVPTPTEGPTLASVSRARTSTSGTLPLAPPIAAPPTDSEHLSLGAPVVRESPVLLSSAPPDVMPAVTDRAPSVAEPALVATELPPAAEEVDAAVDEEYAVRRTLHSYEEAYEELDVMAAADVWPSVDRRALSRAFATLKSQGLDFQSCAITVRDSQATVSCHGTLQVVRKVGNAVPLKADQRWVFKMRRLAGMWKIDEVSTSQAPMMATDRGRGEG